MVGSNIQVHPFQGLLESLKVGRQEGDTWNQQPLHHRELACGHAEAVYQRGERHTDVLRMFPGAGADLMLNSDNGISGGRLQEQARRCARQQT